MEPRREVSWEPDDRAHTVEVGGRMVTLTWVGRINAAPARVYAVAFTDAGQILLVSGAPGDPCCYLPGGGVEEGESPEQALRRELLEEADATVLALEDIGSQRIDEPSGDRKFHRHYWCRVTLGQQVFPRSESTTRHLVSPADFLDALEWGHKDPKAPKLLALALEANRHHENL